MDINEEILVNEEIVDKIAKMDIVIKKSLKDSEQNDEDEVTICNWYCYDGKRCKKLSNSDKFCKMHNILIKDFTLVHNETECSTQKDIFLVPRSKEHIKVFLKSIGYNDDEIMADVVVSKDVIEEMDISNNDYIESTNGDDIKFYYEGLGERGLPKAKNLKLRFIQYCSGKPVVLVDDILYCKECYIKISKKNGYPKLRCLK